MLHVSSNILQDIFYSLQAQESLYHHQLPVILYRPEIINHTY